MNPRIEWSNRDEAMYIFEAQLCIDGKYLFLGEAARAKFDPEIWVFWQGSSVDPVFSDAHFAPFSLDESTLSLEEEKKKIEGFVWLNLWKFVPLVRDLGKKETSCRTR